MWDGKGNQSGRIYIVFNHCGFKSSMKSKALGPNVQQTIVKVTDTLLQQQKKYWLLMKRWMIRETLNKQRASCSLQPVNNSNALAWVFPAMRSSLYLSFGNSTLYVVSISVKTRVNVFPISNCHLHLNISKICEMYI